MPYRRRFSAKMDRSDFDDDVTVVDVYDLASDIGKECEIIIEKYGPDAVTALLPKVINSLELLENLAVRNEKENQALQELTAKISQLENDKIEKAEYRQRFEKEIEAIEEQWRTESAELVTAVSRLQDENKRLRRTINTPADGTSAPPSPAREHDQEVLSRLSSTAEKQRATLRHQELQLQEKQQLIDSLTNQVDKLTQVSRDLRRKHKQLQNQMRLVCEERTELAAIVQSQQRDIATLQQNDAQNKCLSCGAASPTGAEGEQCARPTFSVRELRAILHERNELKLKLANAEEQLHALQLDTLPESADTSPSASTAPTEEDAPVQGPLPAEPDDAPWKRNSGIRKLVPEGVGRGSGWRCRRAPRVAARRRRGSLSAPGIENTLLSVFASSLLSLISPWGHSPGARSRRSPARCPRPVAPPPPPRRHSDPPSPTIHTKHTRSDHNNLKLDLRQELQNNLNNQEVDNWLGSKFEEKVELDFQLYDDRFKHDIPLQRSISLDGGIDIFNYLKNIGSDWTGSSTGSSWTINSDGRESHTFEHYRSFEDIPASPRARSRRASLNTDNVFLGRNLAFTVLKGSYKGIDSGNISPQIKKLQQCFTFASVGDCKAKGSAENLDDMYEGVSRSGSAGSRTPEASSSRSPQAKGVQSYFTFRDLKEIKTSDYEDDDDDKDLEIRVPFYRSMSFESKRVVKEAETKHGRQRIAPMKNELNLRKEVLLKQNLSKMKSCEDLALRVRRGSTEFAPLGATVLRGSYKDINIESGSVSANLLKLKKTFSFACSSSKERVLPTIIISRVSRSDAATGVAKKENIISTNTSNLVEIGRKCDCRICTDDGEDRNFFLRKVLTKLFVKIVSCREYGRKLTCWDENNNFNESEMYTCIINVFKLLVGLWLRHFDHKIDT